MIWLIALLLFCFMTRHSHTLALIMFWVTGLIGLAFGIAAGVAVCDGVSGPSWVIAIPVALCVGAAIASVVWFLLVFVNGLVGSSVESILRAIRG